MQVRLLILYFLLLVFEIPFNLGLNISYKWGESSKTLVEESLKFILSKQSAIVIFNLSFILLLAKIDLILEEQSNKKATLIVCSFGRIKMLFELAIKVVALYMQTLIIQIRVLSLKDFFAKYRVCLKLVMIFALEKWL